MITKEDCKEFALNFKKETGNFPNSTNWSVKNGYPCALSYLKKQFNGSYNEFRDYCNEPRKIRTEELTITWIKNNCFIDDNNCWNWLKSLYPNGYGQVRYYGKSSYSHRIAYLLAKGNIENDLVVRHKCDNRKCCNPEHLELGSYSDNTIDMIQRNQNYKSVNNNDLAWKIRRLESVQERIDFYLQHINIIKNNCYISNILKANSKNGYYIISIDGIGYSLHRLILAKKLGISYSEIDIARHICNNKLCINPDHLENGSRRENALDFREISKASKLNADKVIKIKLAILTEDFSVRGNKAKFDKYWSEQFNVSINTISDVRLNKTWKEIKI